MRNGLAFALGRLFSALPALPALSALRIAGLSFGARRVAHPLRQALRIERLHGAAQPFLLPRTASLAAGHLPHGVFEALGPVRKSLLLGGALARPISAIAGLPPAGCVASEPSLCFGKLARFELKLAERATLVVGLGSLHLLLEIAQPFGRPASAGAGLAGVVPTELSSCALHLFRRSLQLAARLSVDRRRPAALATLATLLPLLSLLPLLPAARFCWL